MLRHNLAGELTVARSEQPNELDMSKNFLNIIWVKGQSGYPAIGIKNQKNWR